MLHIKFRGNRNILKRFSIYGLGGHFSHLTSIILINFLVPTKVC